MRHRTRSYLTSLVALGLLAGIASIASAQERSAIVAEPAPIYVLPDAARTPLRVAAVRTVLRVRAEEGPWLRVEFQDPQFGTRTGYVEARRVQIQDPALKPMDLSVTGAAPAAVAAQQPASQPWQRPGDRVARVTPSRGSRGWFDVNFGLAMSAAEDTLFSYSSFLIDQAAFYARPTRGAEFDLGGGYMFTPQLGIGASLTGAAHRDYVGLGAGIGDFLLAAGATDRLLRTEGAFHIQAMLVPFESSDLRVRLFGGPSYFRYQADMVYDFDFSGGFVTDYAVLETDGQGWGAHVGADGSYFFSKVVGLGGFARYSRATVSIFEPMSEEWQELALGGFQTGGGLRLRF